MNAAQPSPTQHDPISAYAAAHAARAAYDDLVDSDGATATAWRTVYVQIHHAVCDLVELHNSVQRPPLLTSGVIQDLADLGTEALHRARYAERMVESARRGRVIDMSTLQVAS